MSSDEFDQAISRPLFVQTFATTLIPENDVLPELTFVCIQTQTEVDYFAVRTEGAFSGSSDDGTDRFHIREHVENIDKEHVIKYIATQLMTSSREPSEFGAPSVDYSELASVIFDTVEIPVRESPVKGTTLAALLGGGGGSATLLHLLASGVPLADAGLSVLIVAGAIIVFGAANGVRRALDEGLYISILKLFGTHDDYMVAVRRAAYQNRKSTHTRQSRQREQE